MSAFERHDRCSVHSRRQGSTLKRMKIESILCPTDLSPDSDEALRYAIALSRAYKAELILLHCMDGDMSASPNSHVAAARMIEQAVFKYSRSTSPIDLYWRSVIVTSDDAGEAIASAAAVNH